MLTRTDDGCRHKSAWQLVQCAAVVPTPYQGWVLRAGPPALSGVFLPLFFLRRRRKNGAPGGRQPYCMEKIKTQQLPAPKNAIKPLMQCVSASAAASGPHTGYQGTDALANLPGSRNKPTRTTDPHPRGGSIGRGPSRDSRGVFLSIFFLRWRRKNGAPGGRLQSCLAALPIQPQKKFFPHPPHPAPRQRNHFPKLY